MLIQNGNQGHLVARNASDSAVNAVQGFKLLNTSFRNDQIDLRNGMHQIIDVDSHPVQNSVREILMTDHEFDAV